MIQIFDKQTGSALGSISDDQFQFLADHLEEEGKQDDDYYLNATTVDFLEGAGAAPELRRGALLVNPYDELGIAEAISRALTMESTEQRRRMLRMRAWVRRHDILHWRDSFFAALNSQPMENPA